MDIDFPILAAATAGPLAPYELLAHLQASGLKLARSTVYRRLDLLRDGGALELREEDQSRQRPRRSVLLTAQGRELARVVALEAVRREPLESPHFVLALAAAERLDAAALPPLLRVRAAGAARRLTDEERDAVARRDEMTLTRQRRLAHLRADVDWLQSALLRRPEAQPGPAPGGSRRAV